MPYKGKVYCLTVPTGAYLTRRNGKMAITGNSVMFRAGADIMIPVASHQSPGKDLGLLLRVDKANDGSVTAPEYLGMSFDGPDLVEFYHAKDEDFPELAAGRKLGLAEAVRQYLSEEGPASAGTLAHNLNLNRSNVAAYLAASKAVGKRRVGKEMVYSLLEGNT